MTAALVRLSFLEQQNVVPLRIVQHCPTAFDVHEPLLANLRDGLDEITNLEK